MSPDPRSGPIALFARHATAANLLIALMFLCGAFAMLQINRQYFPDFGIDVVTVSVSWPGASAADVDTNIVQAVEPEVRFLNGVDQVVSSSYEGSASVSIELEPGHDMQQALSDVESAVRQIRTLPEDSERPEIRRIVRYETVSRVVISGPFRERSLKHIAKSVRDDLLDRGIDRIDMFGARDEEIWVEVRPETLRQLDLKLSDIGERIRATSEDLPSGELAGGERQVRSLGLMREAREIRDVEVKSFPNGRKLRLGDIAHVTEAFEERGKKAVRLGNPAIELVIMRSISTDALDVSTTVKDYLKELSSSLPPSLVVEEYDVRAKSIRERIGLLVKNGLGGLLLVLGVLFLFLNVRVAFWIAIGIPASLLATIAIMWGTGQTINMISLFGLIMSIGIVVDDAIVVGEHAEFKFQQGLDALDAAVEGARRMAAPVSSSTLTTVAAFMPLFMISGIMGQIISAIPFVVVAVLLASLLECFFVLPGHLSHALRRAQPEVHRNGFVRRLIAFRTRFDARFTHFREHAFRSFVERAVRNRYVTVSIAVSTLLVAIGAVRGGYVGYQFFPSPEPDKVYANIEMVAGSSRADTREAVLELERALYRAVAELVDDPDELVVISLGKTGSKVGGSSTPSAGSADTIGGILLELVSSDVRDVRVAALIEAWREELVPPPGLETLTISGARIGPPGRDIDLRLSGGSIANLKAAAQEVAALLSRFPGVSDVDDDLPHGKPEIILEVNDRGRAMGFTTVEVGRQVRNAIDGEIAKRFPRDDEEIWIRVQFARDTVDNALLETLYLRSPTGQDVALREIVDIRATAGFARIRREDGARQVAIKAEIDPSITRSGEVIEGLLRDGLLDIVERYGVSHEFKGRAEEQRDTNADMRLGAALGLSLIYIILAWVFSSYARPLVVMSVIPIGLVGAVIGHAVWGFDLTILSIFAILGLSGIVINDSIVLVTTVDHRRLSEPLISAVINGSCDRLRAVILTSATTIGGLTPLLFEKSLQAQFLIPMALTLVFGLAVTTFVVLLLVPALILVQDDLARILLPSRVADPASLSG